MSERVLPVFLRNKDIPNAQSRHPSVLEVCLSAERTSGQGTVLGAQEIHGLWRIYPLTGEARNLLRVQGMCLRDVHLTVCDTNPYILRDGSGFEKPSTKLWIDDIPISVADSEIELALKKLNCELRSDIKIERARDSDNKLTRFVTGRRFVFITVPVKPLEKTVAVNIFTARLFHKEQKQFQKTPVCSNCLETGHHRSQCEKEVVCRECKKPGHKRGDKECTMDTSNAPFPPPPPPRGHSLQAAGATGGTTDGVEPVQSDQQNRGRRSERQTTLHNAFDMLRADRSRSDSSKRRRSKDREGRKEPCNRAAKQSKKAPDNHEQQPEIEQDDSDPEEEMMNNVRN